ncbi:hypothetical protein BLOT_005316 [Blomia tropicalis]|nr:hypothetical protein BLOT_005316 [Blomia tropicalis]
MGNPSNTQSNGSVMQHQQQHLTVNNSGSNGNSQQQSSYNGNNFSGSLRPKADPFVNPYMRTSTMTSGVGNGGNGGFTHEPLQQCRW